MSKPQPRVQSHPSPCQRLHLLSIRSKKTACLLDGFIKKTRKTPDEDLDLARKNKRKHERSQSRQISKNEVVGNTGSTSDSFLEEEGIREEVEVVAVKCVISWQLAEAMRKKKKTKQPSGQRAQYEPFSA